MPARPKKGLPIYRVTGGAGFVWVASFDQKGRGTLRLTAIDPSPVHFNPLQNEPPTSNDQTTRTNPETALPATGPAQTANPDTDVARQPENAPELSQPDARITPPETASGTQATDNQIERPSAESAKLNAVVRQLESEKAAAEGKARRMEHVAYGLGVIALLAIVSSIFFAFRRRAVAVEPQRTAPETKPYDVTGHSPVVEIQPTSDAPPTKPSELNSASLEISSKPDANTAETIETGVSEARRLPIRDAAEERVKLPVRLTFAGQNSKSHRDFRESRALRDSMTCRRSVLAVR